MAVPGVKLTKAECGSIVRGLECLHGTLERALKKEDDEDIRKLMQARANDVRSLINKVLNRELELS